ncbi:MAG: transketolase C-terminal domain-containing protein [Candidatus Margulisiibacteriota bacterium]
MSGQSKTMRDVFIEKIHENMREDERIIFIAADLGSPKLDALRKEFPGRFLNVGIAEQNLINVGAGFALEGYTVYCYAIAVFLTMRAFEQIRNNAALLSKNKKLNINFVGVGAGLSYDVSGPSHHCLEDISILGSLPNIEILSPSDWVSAEKMAQYSLINPRPKYFRFDGKPLKQIYGSEKDVSIEKGFEEIVSGKGICAMATGYMTHTALNVAEILKKDGLSIGVIDISRIKPVRAELLEVAKKYEQIITLEEGFVTGGGMGHLLSDIEGLGDMIVGKKGFKKGYVFDVGSRESLHKKNGLDAETIAADVKKYLKNKGGK